jgi:two-component system sensor histidine kinase/response regulator
MARPRPRVLLVDDVEANLIALEAQLEKLNCEPVRARSGNEGLRLLLKMDFAVVLLDVQMSEMDGYEVARLARDNPVTREVPIIFVTATHQTEANALKGYGNGGVDFLFKPVNPEILRSKVRVFLELYLSRRNLADEIEAHKSTLAELDAFNYSVSHDLRAPLRPLDGFSRALLEDYGDKLDAQATDYLRRIRAGAQRMGQLIEDLLKLSQLTRAPLRIQTVDLVPLAAVTIDELRRDDAAHEVSFISVAEAKVEGDSGLLRIVLENLLRNAWKFTRKSAPAQIELGVKTEAEKTVYFVRDTGAGFDSAQAQRLFQPFQRLHSAAQFEGTGIGLAIVQRIIRRHGGEVWAEAAVGRGATFHFTLGDAAAMSR